MDLLCDADAVAICCLHKVRTPPEMKAQLTSASAAIWTWKAAPARSTHSGMTLCPLALTCMQRDIRLLNWLPEMKRHTAASRRASPCPGGMSCAAGKHDWIHKLGISVRDIAIHENVIDLNDLQKYVIQPW